MAESRWLRTQPFGDLVILGRLMELVVFDYAPLTGLLLPNYAFNVGMTSYAAAMVSSMSSLEC